MLSSLFFKWRNELDHNQPIKYYRSIFANKEISCFEPETACQRSESCRQSDSKHRQAQDGETAGWNQSIACPLTVLWGPVLWNNGFTLLPRWIFLSGWFTEAETRKCLASDFGSRTSPCASILVINWWCWMLWRLFHFGCCSFKSPFCHCQKGDLPSERGQEHCESTYQSQKLPDLRGFAWRPRKH